ncbi:membrane protein insertion efficiency factor YidD [Candidatus Daviesbacteria bacterium]|nr:membrane protein insertion efficiency factor YidD [Candidatus Daviesbacteria bacterium]
MVISKACGINPLKIIKFIINFYQDYLSLNHGLLAFFAPGGACRYEPSCSEYSKRVIIKYGVAKGGWLAIKRIGSCR